MHVIVWYILKTDFVWLLLNVLVFATCIRHKADLVALHVLLLPCPFSNFFLATFPSFIKLPPTRSCIFLFLLNAIVGLLKSKLRNSRLWNVPIFSYEFWYYGSVLLYVNTSSMIFLLLIFSLFCKMYLYVCFYMYVHACIYIKTYTYFYIYEVRPD